MTATLLLRVTSVISLLFAAGHTLGGRRSWSPGETDVLKAMRAFRFDAFGVSRTYLDFYRGFGFLLSVFLFLQAVLLWQLATMAKSNAAAVRPIVGSFAVASVAIGILTWKFLFPMPVVFCVAMTVGLAAAFLAAS